MRKPRHTFVRTLAILALLVSSLGFFTMPAASAPQTQESGVAAFQAATGTVTVSKYLCDGLDGVVWNGTVGATCVPSTGTFDFYLYGDGTADYWTLEVDGTDTITLAAGTYEVLERDSWTRMDVVVAAGANTAVTVQNPSGDPLPPPPPPAEPEIGWVQVEKYYCPGLETVSYDPSIVTDDCWAGDATLAFYLYGDGTDDYSLLTLGTDGVGDIELAAGTYAMVEQGTYTQIDVTVTDGVVTFLTVVNPGGPLPEPEPEYGLVEAVKFYCPDATEAYFLSDEDVVDDNCVLGPATFTFYLVGDGTADYWQLDVWEDGYGAIELVTGTYEVYEEGTGIMTTIEVVANESTVIGAVNPGDAPAPRNGTVNISKFTCTNISETIFSSDSFAVMSTEALPTFEPACEPGSGTFTFYLVGDGTADYWQIEVDGTGSIELAPGTYEVVEEETLASTFITVYPGDFLILDVQNPAGGDVVPGSSVNVVKFYCDTVTETEFLSYSGSEYSDRLELPTSPDCVPGPATFTFYLVGDGTADYAQLEVDGSGTIGLEPGIYEVVEEGSQAHFQFEVFADENTSLIVNNPMPDDGEVPGDDGVTPPAKPADKDTSTGGVTKLPSTGSGMSDSTGALALAAAAVAALSGAGALTLRKKG